MMTGTRDPWSLGLDLPVPAGTDTRHPEPILAEDVPGSTGSSGSDPSGTPGGEKLHRRTEELFQEHQGALLASCDSFFAGLMLFQWLLAILTSVLHSPRAWQTQSWIAQGNIMAALIVGGTITLIPTYLAHRHPGRVTTRQAIAVGQMLMSGLLIHLNGGSAETHFHVFGSLAFLAFYRDGWVLASASAVTIFDHLLRGIYWPESLHGTPETSLVRWVEFTGWVIFVDFFLSRAAALSRTESRVGQKRRAELEETNRTVEERIRTRTKELLERTHELAEANEALIRKSTELARVHRMETVGRLAGGLAHEFNNLVMVTLCHAEILQRQIRDDEGTRVSVEAIVTANEHAKLLVSKLLAFSRMQTMAIQPLDLNTTIEDLVDMLDPLMGRPVRVVTELAPDLPLARADPSPLVQVLLNLALNARDAMPEGGTLTLRTREVRLDTEEARRLAHGSAGAFIELEVEDTGTGMDPEICESIFQPFFTTKSQGHGTGLGLSTVYGIVSQLGGHILCESHPGEGTCFKVRLARWEDS